MKSIFVIIIFIVSLLFINQQIFNQDISYQQVKIKENDISIIGTITRPRNYVETNNYPTIVVFHGFSASKEMMRAFTEEFAKQGFLTLTIDDIGHGESDPGLDEKDSLLKTGLIALNYISTRADVDHSKIGLLGHSMGGNIVLETASNSVLVKANVVIGNPIEDLDDDFKELNTTNPKNLLVAVGEFDELVSREITKRNFKALTGSSSLEEGVIYGDFSAGTARKLIFPQTNHILEIINPDIITESLNWMSRSLDVNLTGDLNGRIHTFHQLLSCLLYISIVAFAILLSKHSSQRNDGENFEIGWFIHGLFSVIGFVVSTFFMNIFPVIFLGMFIAWFGLTTLSYTRYLAKNNQELTKNWRSNISDLGSYKGGLIVFGGIFVILEIILFIVPWDMRFAIPFLSYITPLRIAIIAFPIFIVGILFFEADQLRLPRPKSNYFASVSNTFLRRSWPYLVILVLYYPPILLGFTGLPDLLGFLTFFIVGFIPVMLTLTFITEYPRYHEHKTITGSIIAAGFLAWVLAATLPIS